MDDEPVRSWSGYAARMWVLAMVLNLPMPLWVASVVYAMKAAEPMWAMTGIFAACLTFLGTGFYFAGYRYEFLRRITNGGFIVALTQFVPVMQFIAGMVGVAVWTRVCRPYLPDAPAIQALESYTITWIVGQILVLASFTTGCVLRSNLFQFLASPNEP